VTGWVGQGKGEPRVREGERLIRALPRFLAQQSVDEEAAAGVTALMDEKVALELGSKAAEVEGSDTEAS
jgi:hypothetical protein